MRVLSGYKRFRLHNQWAYNPLNDDGPHRGQRQDDDDVKRPPSRLGAEEARGLPPQLQDTPAATVAHERQAQDAKFDHAPLPAAIGRLVRQMEAKFEAVDAELRKTFKGRLKPTPADYHARGAGVGWP